MSFILALVALILVIVFYVTHALPGELALLLGLLAVAIMAAGYGDVLGFVQRRPPASSG